MPISRSIAMAVDNSERASSKPPDLSVQLAESQVAVGLKWAHF